MKKYIEPMTTIVAVNTDMHILAGSGGVNNGDSVGNGYNESDATYARQHSSIWGADDEEE